MTHVRTGFPSAVCCSNCLWGRYINRIVINYRIELSIGKRTKPCPVFSYFGSISGDLLWRSRPKLALPHFYLAVLKQLNSGPCLNVTNS